MKITTICVIAFLIIGLFACDFQAAKRNNEPVQSGQIGRFQMHPWRLGEEPYQFFVIDTTSGEIWWYNKDETRWQRQAPSLRGHID